jgi:hypothetical protein
MGYCIRYQYLFVAEGLSQLVVGMLQLRIKFCEPFADHAINRNGVLKLSPMSSWERL